jgi:hypothetical protein
MKDIRKLNKILNLGSVLFLNLVPGHLVATLNKFLERTRNNHQLSCKVKLSLCFNWAPRHEDVLGEWSYSSMHTLTSALDGGEWLASRSGRLTPRERAHGTHWIRGWMGPRAVVDAVVKRKIPSPCQESNPRTPIVQPIAQRYTDWAVTALICHVVSFKFGLGMRTEYCQ